MIGYHEGETGMTAGKAENVTGHSMDLPGFCSDLVLLLDVHDKK